MIPAAPFPAHCFHRSAVLLLLLPSRVEVYTLFLSLPSHVKAVLELEVSDGMQGLLRAGKALRRGAQAAKSLGSLPGKELVLMACTRNCLHFRLMAYA